MTAIPRGRAALLGALLPVLCAAPAAAQVFTRITDAANPIVAEASAGSYMGAAWVDVDDDGLLDLFMVRRDAIFHNQGGGVFTRVGGLITDQGNGLGTTWSDFDNDGDLDCFLSGGEQAGSGRGSILYRNEGWPSFTRVDTGVIGAHLANSGWACAFADVDNDAWTDLVIAAANGFGGVSHENRLLMNNGDGTFRDVDSTVVTDTLGAYTVPTWSDYDQDGDVDLFIGSGAIFVFRPDNHYRNRAVEDGAWGFERISTAPIATDSLDGQVWNWVDYDNDGDLDAFQTNYNAGMANNLYRNDGGTYVRMTAAQVGTIVSQPGNALTNLWADFDNDGDLDCLVTHDGSQPNDYFANDGDGTFTRDTAIAPAVGAGPHYGASAGDYDNDGDLDLFVMGRTISKALFRNDTANGNSWLRLHLTGAGAPGGSNRSALGALVRVKATIAGAPVWQLREVSAQNAFCSHSALDPHFGLGDAATVDSLVVRWPSGLVEVRVGVAVDQVLAIAEQPAASVPASQGSLPASLWSEPSPLRSEGVLHFTLVQAGEAVLGIYDVAGRRVVELARERLDAGRHQRTWDARDGHGLRVPPGVYFARLDAAGTTALRKFAVLP